MAKVASQETNGSGLSYYGSSARSLQTFTIPSGYDTLTDVDLLVNENGTLPGNYTLEIYATSGGLPTGSALKTVNKTAADLSSGYNWENFNFSDLTVTPGAKYAIVTKQTSTSGVTNSVLWGHYDSASYSGGSSYYSTNSGSSWISLSGDWCFKIYASVSSTNPSVTTDAASSVTATTVTLNGTVNSIGSASLTSKGFYLSTDGVTWTYYDVTPAGTTGAYTKALTGLLAGTTYQYYATALNNAGLRGNGSVVEFTTSLAAPTITTDSYTNLSSTGARINATVSDDGGATVTERGVCWNTSINPTTANSKQSSGTGEGSFAIDISTMSPNTAYHVRAYAINSQGTSYGADITFTTKDLVKYWAQSFVPGVTGALTRIDIAAKLVSGTSGNLKVRIYTNNAGSPGTLLATASTVQVTSASYSWIQVPISLALTSGTTYWIVIEDPIVIGSYHIKIGSNSAGGYASGAIKYTKSSAPTTWINTSHTTDDIAFKAYTQPSLTPNFDITVRYKKRWK